MSGLLDGRVAVVTGASRGVGRAIAAALLEAGAAVATVSRSKSDLGDWVAADVSREDDVEHLAATVSKRLGEPTILINAAGTYGPMRFVYDGEPAEWIETLMLNTIGPYLTCHRFVPGMLAAGWGRIVNVTSAASLHPPGRLNSAYGTSKVALNQFTRHLAAELRGSGVTANVLHPGDVRTAIWSDMAAKAEQLGREGDPYRDWVEWVDDTGGDPPEKAGDAVLQIIAGNSNGEFHWIDDPLQPPIPSWTVEGSQLPWKGYAAGDSEP